MPYGYLTGVVLMGVLVLAALRPPRRPRRLALAAYLVGLMINEVPLPFLALLLWSTIDSILFGTLLHTPAGWVVLAAGLLVAAGMVYLQVRATRARPAVRTALEEIAPDEPLRPTTSPWLSRLIPLPVRPRTVERLPNLSYAPGGREHTLDLYRRRDLTSPAPVLIYLHQGGYFSGNKRFGGRLLINRMAGRGWIVVSANYGLRPQVGYPEHLIDAKRVIAWVHREAERYGMDARTIVASGSSAGAHLSVLAALTPGDPLFQPGFEDVDTRLAGAVGLFGYYGRYYGRTAAEVPASTPFAFDPRDAPPVMLVHGDRDSYTPVEAARALAEHLEASARPVVYAELPGAQHGFDLAASERFEAVVDGIEVFLESQTAGGNHRPGSSSDHRRSSG